MAEPAGLLLIQHMAGRKFQPVAALILVNNGERAAVRSPVGPLDVVHHFAGRAANQWHARECARIKKLRHRMAAQRERHFARCGDGERALRVVKCERVLRR